MPDSQWMNELYAIGIIGASGMAQTENGYERIPVSMQAEYHRRGERIEKRNHTCKSGYGDRRAIVPPPTCRLSDFRHGEHSE